MTVVNPELGEDEILLDSDVEEQNQESEMESEVELEIEDEDVRVGDDLYQLTKEEGKVITAAEWKKFFLKSEYSEDIMERMDKMKPYEQEESTGKTICTKSMNQFVLGVCMYINKGGKIKSQVMKSLCKAIFSSCDLLYLITIQLNKMISNGEMTGKFVWFNVFNFLRFTPNPHEEVKSLYFNQKFHILRSRKKGKLVSAWQNTWISIMRCDVPRAVLVNMIPYITDKVLNSLKEPHKTSDFFFRIFEKGDVLSILSLGAIFRLMTKHNFDYPNFYDQVYSLTKPFVLYMKQKFKFIELLNIFLSSTHLPTYVVAGFAKRLSRCLLYAPLDAQEPILGLIKNLIIRHISILPLMHREVPSTLDNDPYDMDEPKLCSCKATESSFWEIKTLIEHWSKNVGRRATFVEKSLPNIESIVRNRTVDEYFSKMMLVKYGEAADEENDEENANGYSGGNDRDYQYRGRRGYSNYGREPKEHTEIPTSFSVPTSDFFPTHSVTYDYGKFWIV
ncbi:unnamed protein product [Auanema sp. JU1783]|nr:unnamed protein product [Auanema sp. JU1783]